jgi:Uma2 family endonuclease
MTLKEWADLDEEIPGELVDGQLEEEEMPTHLHELVVAWLLVALHPWARARGGRVTGSETKIAVGTGRGRKPDLSIFLRRGLPALDDALITVAPHVVIEVASARPRDVRRDRIDKQIDYARAGVRYYWIVDPQLRTLEVFELVNRHYRVALAASAGTVRAPGCPGLKIDLDALWREIDTASRARPARRR